MYGSPAMSKDLNFPFPASAASKQRKEEADFHHQQQQQQQQQQQMNSGLLRYRSAPNTFLGEVCEEFLPHRSTTPEAATAFTRFMAPDFRDHPREKQGDSEVTPTTQSDGGGGGGDQTFPSSFTQLLFHSPHPPPPPPPQLPTLRPMGVDQEQGKSGTYSNLVRHSSSPAGFFSQLSCENGFNPSRLKTQISSSSRQGSSGFMSQISEVGHESMGASTSPDESGNNRCYIPGYPVPSWDDSVLLSESFSGTKRGRLDPSEAQNGEARNHVSSLTRHLSLPKSSSESTEFIQFQDAVPWKLRAKRGFATHPRSIAERVRRTKISERMRKLQELVPNMDKQTNTADMLELAVEYINDLQKQVKTITDTRANCTCSSNSK